VECIVRNKSCYLTWNVSSEISALAYYNSLQKTIDGYYLDQVIIIIITRGAKQLGLLVARATKFHTLVRHIFSTFITVVSLHTEATESSQFHGSAQQSGIEFGGSSYIFGKFLDQLITLLSIICWEIFTYQTVSGIRLSQGE